MKRPAMKNHLRPYLSESGGRIGRDTSIAMREAEPRRAPFQSGSHIRSSFYCQFSRERLSEKSTSQELILGSPAQMFSTVHIWSSPPAAAAMSGLVNSHL